MTIDVDRMTSNVKSKLQSLTESPVLGGWSDTLNKQVTGTEVNDDVHLKGFRLQSQKRRSTEHHKYVTDKRDISAVGNEISTSLIEFITQRFPSTKIVHQSYYAINIMPEADQICASSLWLRFKPRNHGIGI